MLCACEWCCIGTPVNVVFSMYSGCRMLFACGPMLFHVIVQLIWERGWLMLVAMFIGIQ